MKPHDELLSLVPLYALGRLDGEELEVLEHHLADGCETCDAALRDAEDVAAELAGALDPVAPSELGRRRLLADVRTSAARSAAQPASRGSVLRWAALAAGIAVAAALGLQMRALDRALDRANGERAVLSGELTALRGALDAERAERTALAAEVGAARTALAAEVDLRARQSAELSAVTVLLDTLTAPLTRPVLLAAPDGAATGATAKAFLDPHNGRLALFVYGLRPLPPDRTYQLWVIVDGEPVSAGVFEVGQDGRSRLDDAVLPPFEGGITVAVTEEPAGGVPKPTGPMVLVGS